MFHQMPIVQKKSTFYNKNAKIYKTVKYEDIYRGVNKKDVEDTLADTYAEGEVQRLIEKYFDGDIESLEFINYNPQRLLNNFFFGVTNKI